jgi:hypothetical protein
MIARLERKGLECFPLPTIPVHEDGKRSVPNRPNIGAGSSRNSAQLTSDCVACELPICTIPVENESSRRSDGGLRSAHRPGIRGGDYSDAVQPVENGSVRGSGPESMPCRPNGGYGCGCPRQTYQSGRRRPRRNCGRRHRFREEHC